MLIQVCNIEGINFANAIFEYSASNLFVIFYSEAIFTSNYLEMKPLTKLQVRSDLKNFANNLSNS